jgi:hypothetical protein
MIESILQTFLLLGTFDIILISVSIANYAISASYLGRETRLTRGRMEKRKQRLNEIIKELQAKGLPIEELKKETKEAEDDIKGLGSRLFFLSWLGAVILPSICFLASLINGVIGMNSDIFLTNSQTLVNSSMVASISLLGLGFFLLMVVIGVVDSVARKLPMPEFEIAFPNREKTIELEGGESTMVRICVFNKGEDVADDTEFFAMFPLNFKIQPIGKQRVTRTDTLHEYPNCNCFYIPVGTIHVGVTEIVNIDVTPSREKRTYEILIRIHEAKIGEYRDTLTIEVVD